MTAKEISETRKSLHVHDVQLTSIFGALGDSTRLKIVRILMKYNKVCVSDTAKVLGISVPGISQQLRILESSGLVSRKREGRKVCYSVNENNPVIKAVLNFI